MTSSSGVWKFWNGFSKNLKLEETFTGHSDWINIVEKLSDAVTSVEKTFEKNRTAQKQRRLKARINQRELGYKPITQKPEVEPLGAFSKNLSDRDVENYYNYGERGINYLQTRRYS